MAVARPTTPNGLVRRVQKTLGKTSQAAALAPLLYGSKSLNGLADLPAAWLAGNASAAYEFIADKPAGRHKLRIRPAPAAGNGASGAGSVIEILNDDMPFLVDSVLGELQARGLAVELLLHPIFKTRRDKSGRLQAVAALGEGSWRPRRRRFRRTCSRKLWHSSSGSRKAISPSSACAHSRSTETRRRES